MIATITNTIAEDHDLLTKRKVVDLNIRTFCRQFAIDVHSHLNEKKTIAEMFSWTAAELPNDDDLKVIITKIDQFVVNRINIEVMHRMQNVEKQRLKTFIYDLLNKECFKVLTKCESMNLVVFGNNCEFLQDTQSTRTKDDLDGFELSIYVKVLCAITLIIHPALCLLLYGLGSIFNHKIHVFIYKRDKATFANKRALTCLENLSIGKLEGQIVSVLHIDDVLDEYFGIIIPNRLQSGRNMIHKLQADLRTPRELQRQCHIMEKHVLRINDRVVASHMELFQENMIMVDDITMISDGIAEIRINTDVCKSSVITSTYNASENSETKYNGLAEISRLRTFQHHNLAKMYGICPFEEKERVGYYIFIEFCERNLDVEVISEGMSWSKSKDFIKHAIAGLSYLHANGTVHKDIRLSTIMINGEEAKLSYGEFGIQSKLKGRIEGVPTIKSPEAIQSSESFEADIFQIGIVIWDAMFGKRAYCDGDKPTKETYEELYLAIVQGERPPIDPLQSKISFLQECWNHDPDARPSLEHIEQSLEL